MLRSYVVIALRNLMRDKVVTGINIVGLSVAIAVSAILGIGIHRRPRRTGESRQGAALRVGRPRHLPPAAGNPLHVG